MRNVDIKMLKQVQHDGPLDRIIIMDFSYTETQDMIRETLSRFLADTYDFDSRNKMIASGSGRDGSRGRRQESAQARRQGHQGRPLQPLR